MASNHKIFAYMDSLSEYFSSNQSVVKFPESGSIDLVYVYKSY